MKQRLMSNPHTTDVDSEVTPFERLTHSLYSAFLFNVGEITIKGGSPRLDLDAARDTIAQLESLLLKTYGNLTEQESAELTAYIEKSWDTFRTKVAGNKST